MLLKELIVYLHGDHKKNKKAQYRQTEELLTLLHQLIGSMLISFCFLAKRYERGGNVCLLRHIMLIQSNFMKLVAYMACRLMEKHLHTFLVGNAKGLSPLRKICERGSIILKYVLKDRKI